jgi:hypothetical protein
MRVLPGVAPASKNQAFPDVAAERIPDSVLTRPIIGEIRRFDGTVAPSGWALTGGQTVNIADNRPLFSILRTVAGGDGKTTFKLPNPTLKYIIAVAGTYPTSPAVFAMLGRHVSKVDSLGDGAIAAVPRLTTSKPERDAKTLAEHRLAAAAIHVGPASPTRLSRDLRERIRQARQDAGNTAVARLSAATAARLSSVVQSYLSGRIALNEAATELAPAITNGEADAIRQTHDAMIRQFRTGFDGSRFDDPQRDASRLLLSVTITDEQVSTALARGIELR